MGIDIARSTRGSTLTGPGPINRRGLGLNSSNSMGESGGRIDILGASPLSCWLGDGAEPREAMQARLAEAVVATAPEAPTRVKLNRASQDAMRCGPDWTGLEQTGPNGTPALSPNSPQCLC